jgi:hypothetical protein
LKHRTSILLSGELVEREHSLNVFLSDCMFLPQASDRFQQAI